MGRATDLVTIAEAVGSDVTNVVRDCVTSGRHGAAAHVLSTYLENDHCVAVSDYTKELVVSEAARLDALVGTSFAAQLDARVRISYPAVDSSAYLTLDPDTCDDVLGARGLVAGQYVLFLSRLASAKGLDDLVAAYAGSRASERVRLVLAGRGPQEEQLRRWIAESPAADRIDLLTDVDDDEKPALMAGSTAFVLPSRPQPEFVETFGIALVESMLAGGGPVITCATGASRRPSGRPRCWSPPTTRTPCVPPWTTWSATGRPSSARPPGPGPAATRSASTGSRSSTRCSARSQRRPRWRTSPEGGLASGP